MKVIDFLWSVKYYLALVTALIFVAGFFYLVNSDNLVKNVKDSATNEMVSEDLKENFKEADLKDLKENPKEAELLRKSLTQNTLNIYLIAVTVISIFVAIISIILTYRIYSDNRKIKESGATVPEEWADHLLETIKISKNSSAKVTELISNQSEFLKYFNTLGIEFNKQVKENKDILYDFQKSLDGKDIEIKKYQNGYDISILKNLLSQIVDMHIKAKKALESNSENKELKNVTVLLWEVLSSVGVEKYIPQKGLMFSDIYKFVEVAGEIETEEEDKVTGQIAEVMSPGYIIIRNDKKIVLGKSKIKYFLKKE